ncbi:unnamed protein product [Meganyctiphanes norvegica]|uniref:Tudor domain-containing protein n=1 Tax=Meganyctiphanes norvegica TaxID=48144 RepID=A0AAV2QZA3_MEGNR
MFTKSVILPLSGALMISGLAGTIIYYLYKKDKDEQSELTTKSKEWSSLEVSVPISAVGIVIGRQGANIKLIQERTGTKINFKDEEVEGQRICIIRGLDVNALQAKRLVIKTIEDQPVVEVDQIFVPVQAVGRIIGRNGDVVRNMSRCSGCKILIDREERQDDNPIQQCPEDMKSILLKGTKEQIDSAKVLILAKLHEEEEMRQQIQASAANMAPRGRKYQDSTESLNNLAISPVPSLNQESLSIPASDRFIEAYVSAVDNATHFWLQVVGPRSIQLDKLVKDMTEYYELEDNKEMNEVNIEKMKNGDIIAARFPHDSSWYRGQVCQVVNNDGDSSRSKVTVYYVDFGDTETIEITNICELRTDFLKLNFQAIECKLAYVTEVTEVSEEATEAFEELTYTAQWKVMMVKIMGYFQAENNKTLPLIQIIDTNGATDVDVAEELVQRGFLEWLDGAPKSTTSSTPSNSI